MGQSTDLLVIILIVAIVAVVLDGLRRKWRDRQDRVVVKLDRNLLRDPAGGDEELFPSSELPNGGARTLPRQGDAPPPRRYGPRLKNGKHREQSDAPSAADRGKVETVPVLMDTVEVDETDIEHTNVFASAEPSQQFTPEEFEGEPRSTRTRSNSNVVEDKDMLDAQLDGLELHRDPLAPQAGRKSRQDDDEFEDEEFEDEEDDFEDEDDDDDDDFEDDDFDDEEDDEDDDLEDEEGAPRRRRPADDDDDDEWEDDEDDWDEDDDEEDEEDDEDDWEDEEEDEEQLSGDYENEPALLEETYARAASHFTRQPELPQARIEPGFGEEDETQLNDLPEEEMVAESFDESFEDDALFDSDLGEFKPDPITAAAIGQPAAGEPKARKVLSKAAEKSAPAKDAVKEAKDKRSFFSKSLLGRQQQVDLFQEELPADEDHAEATAEESGPQEVLIINVMARPGFQFRGADLLEVVRQQGLQLGEMSIFHRHEKADGGGRVVFSMANMVKPGVFDLTTMDEFSTPGVSLFLQVPNKFGNMAAFDLMLNTATALREQLDGELKDEHRSVFTRQTAEHVRQRIRDFELSQLARR